MLKHKLLLADGTVLTSGESSGDAIRSVTLTEQVSDGTDLCPGAACAACAELELWAPENGLRIAQGDELTLYRLDTDTGAETPAGIFLAEKPTKSSANVYNLTAYDRMTLFDRDLTLWLQENQGMFPLTLAEFIRKLCAQCGVQLTEGALDALPNGGYEIRAFSADGVTGRQLLQWAAQAAGRFARMTPAGMLELGWYPPSEGAPPAVGPGTALVDVLLRLSGEVVRTVDARVWRIFRQSGYYLQGSLAYEDYETAPVDKVQLRQSDADVGVIWPPEQTADNALVIQGNLLLTADSAARLEPVAQTLFALIGTESYTPLRLTMPFAEDIRPGCRLAVADSYGRVHHTLVMKRVISGQVMELESTGNARRDSTTAVNAQSYRDIQGKVMEIRSTVDGLCVNVQQDFPGNRLEDVEWVRSGGDGTVSIQGRQVSLRGNGSGICGASCSLPQDDCGILPGAAIRVSLRWQVTDTIEVGESGASAIVLWVNYVDGSADYLYLADLARPGNPASPTSWAQASAEMTVAARAVSSAYLFAYIKGGTGALEAEEPALEITSARYTGLSLTANGAQLSSAVIDLTGNVTFTDLAGEGKTTINGANITTGTIDASLVRVAHLSADDIESGTLASRNGALTVDLDNAALVAGSGADLRVGSQASYTRFLSYGFDSYTDGTLRSGIENNWSWFNRSLTALFSTSGLTGIGYKNASGVLYMGYVYDPYSDIESGYVNYISGAAYCTETSNARIQRCRYQLFLENSVSGQNDAQIEAYDDAVRVYGQNLYVYGNIGCSGAKNRIVATQHYGNRALNAMESAGAVFCDSGSGRLDETGVCLLGIHPVLEECLDPHALPQWLVSGCAPGFWVEKQGRGALVHGPAGAEFDWMLVAPQRGYADCYADAVAASPAAGDGLAEGELDSAAAYGARRMQELDSLTDAVAGEWARLEEMEELA